MRLPALLRPILAAALLCLFAAEAWAVTAVPPLQKRVTDLTGTLSPQAVSRIEQRLAAFEQEKGTQVAVLMLPSVQPESIEEYAVRVFEQWKLGRKGVDDGVLLVIARNDRQLRIEVGYGLEGALNDATAKRIISDDIVPHFKRGDFAAGVEAGVSRILRVADGEPLPPPAAAKGGDGHLPLDPFWLFGGLMFAPLVTRLLTPLTGRAGAAALVGVAAGIAGWALFGAIIAGVFCGLLAFIFAFNGAMGRGGSGSWSSGSHRGGGFGGGFGGGGGRSGGGGASGRW
jgi:uncharacterized protein